MSLDNKILELKKLICVMQKDAKGHGYDYVSEESILLAINEKMIETLMSGMGRKPSQKQVKQLMQQMNKMM